MATWVTSAYLDNAITTAARTALGLTGSVLTQYEAAARATVVATMQYAGYTPSTSIDTSTDTGAFLAKCVAALIIREAYQYRKGVRLPFDPSGTISEGLFLLDAVYEKKLPIPGLEPSTLDGYGGGASSPSVGTFARPSYFGPNKLSGF